MTDEYKATGQGRPFGDAHPSWYPKVLETLARDYPEISEEVWATAISENATKNNAAREHP